MKREDLKVGQRVQINWYGENKTGTIVDLCDRCVVGIRLVKKPLAGHSCNGKCEDGCGWYVNPEHITKIFEGPSKKETEEPIEYDYVELSNETRLRVSQIINGNVVVKDSKVYKKVKKEYTEMTVKEIEKKLNVKNLKIIG